MDRGYMGLGLLWAFLHGLGLALMMGMTKLLSEFL